MRLRRLGWAGVEIESDGETLVIDYVQDKSPMAPLLRNSEVSFPAASNRGNATAALLTHLHADQFRSRVFPTCCRRLFHTQSLQDLSSCKN